MNRQTQCEQPSRLTGNPRVRFGSGGRVDDHPADRTLGGVPMASDVSITQPSYACAAPR